MKRVVVVGAGIIGMAVAYALRRRSYEVAIVDRASAGSGCSWGNAGWICPSLSTPLASPDQGLWSLAGALRRDSPLHIHLPALPALAPWLWQFWRHCNAVDYAQGVAALARLNARSMQGFDAWLADGVEFEMHRTGILWAFTDLARAERAADALAALGLANYPRPHVLDGPALRSLEPGLGASVHGGFVVDRDRHVRPESLVQGLAHRLRALGVEMRDDVDIRGGRTNAGVLHALRADAGGDVAGDLFVIAAGAWSGSVATRLGASLQLQAGKGYSVTLAESAPSFARALYLPDAKLAVTPLRGHLRVAGTMEFSGLNTRVEGRRVQALQRSAQGYFRDEPAWSRAETWVGARPVTPDGLPYVGRLAPYRNVFVAAGHGMLGVTLAPATAEWLAELIEHRHESRADNPFDPAR